jgi:hypothetical protein
MPAITEGGDAAGNWGQEEEEEEEEEDEEEQVEAEGVVRGGDGFEGEEQAASGSGYGPGNVRARTLYSLPKYGEPVPDRPTASVYPAGPSGRKPGPSAGPAGASSRTTPGGALGLDEADLDMLEGMKAEGGQPKRPEYKFNKKAARTKGDRGQLRNEGGFDGAAMLTGKKGGLVRVTGY